MKPNYLILLAFSLFFACKEDENKVRPNEEHAEVPELIAASKPCSTLYKSIMDMFFEHENNQERHATLFTETAEKSIVLTHDSDVFITFISEGAGFENSLGYYTYKAADGPPGSSKDFELNILFPNVSETVLNKGDMLQLGTGKFEAGTVIGFFLVIRGWENGFVNFRKVIHFTDYDYNLNHYQQHILFKEGTCGDIVMAFEDKPLDNGSDYDYNDVIFTISDNNEQKETVRFDLTNMIQFENTEDPS